MRGAGNVLRVGGSWPGPVTGATGVSPLFQLASADQSPLLPLTHSAGTRWSLRYSMSAVGDVEIDVRRCIANRPAVFPVLAYCQKCQASGELGGLSQGP